MARSWLTLLERASESPVEHDPEWASPCECMPAGADGMVRWRPVAIEPPASFAGIDLHPDLVEFFGSYWGGHVYGRHSGEAAILWAAWNRAELDRIKRSVVKQIAAQVPVCVATTESDWYFGVDNATGEVWLCEPGRPPIERVATSLAVFLDEIASA